MRQDLLPKTVEGKLARIVEECGEVLQAIGKIQRFGYTATDPLTNKRYDNWLDLQTELFQLSHAINQLDSNRPDEK